MDDDPWYTGEFSVVRIVDGEELPSSVTASISDGDVEEQRSPPSLTASGTAGGDGVGKIASTDEHDAQQQQQHGGGGADGDKGVHHEEHVVEVRRGRLWLRPRLARDWDDKDRHRKV
jgi:hypothetical protein